MTVADERLLLLEAAERFTAFLAQRFSYIEARDVSLRAVPNALVTRTTFPSPGQFTGAVYDGNSNLIRSSLRLDPLASQPVDPETAPESEREGARSVSRAFYGGILFLILGHFIFESAARLWPLIDFEQRRTRRKERLPIIFHPSDGFNLDIFMGRPFFRKALASFGFDRSNLILAEENYRVDLLYYAEPLSIYHEYVHPEMGRIIDHLVEELGRSWSLRRVLPRPGAASGKRVFLSRARWDLHVRIANENEIETVLQERGFSVVHPQKLQPDEMIALMQGAELVASSDGSHAHLLAFARPGTRSLHFDTRPVPTQTAIERLRHIDALHLPLFENPAGVWDQETSRVDTRKLADFVDLVLSQKSD